MFRLVPKVRAGLMKADPYEIQSGANALQSVQQRGAAS